MRYSLTTLSFIVLSMLFSSCNSIKTVSRSSVPFPGMTVSRSDYRLSDDVTASVDVKEFSTLFGLIRGAKTEGEEKRTTRSGEVAGYNLDKASKIAVYRLLDDNSDFDYLTNIRVKKEYTKKWYFLFSTYKTTVKVTAKGITIKTDK
jgi:hypothetical protein